MTDEMQKRRSQLFNIGMAETKGGFRQGDLFITTEQIETYTDDHFSSIIFGFDSKIKIRLHQSTKNKKSDEEKMSDFIKSLEQITGPEITHPSMAIILEGQLQIIKTARDFGKQEMGKLKHHKVTDKSIN